MKTTYARNIGRCAALGLALWALLYARAQVQTAPTAPAVQAVQVDPQQQLLELEQQQLQKQRRQELRSMVRQQRSGPVVNTAAAAPATPASAAVSNGPRRLTVEEKTELRRQLARDLRVAQVGKP